MSTTAATTSTSTSPLLQAPSSQGSHDDDQNCGIVVVAGIAVGIMWIGKQGYRLIKHGIVGLCVTGRDLTVSGASQGKKCLLEIKKGPSDGMRMSADLATAIYKTQSSLGQSGSRQLRKVAVTNIQGTSDAISMIGELGKHTVRLGGNLSLSGYRQTNKTCLHILQVSSVSTDMFSHATVGIRSTGTNLTSSGVQQMIRSVIAVPTFASETCAPLKDLVSTSFKNLNN